MESFLQIGGRMELTILLPCLNEEKTVAACVTQAMLALEQNGLDGEVLVADNGSTDKSVQKAEAAGARIVVCPRQGYGNALRFGIEKAKGKYVIMADCDCSYHFDNVMGFLEKLRQGADMVIGNRFALPMEKEAMPLTHKYLGVPVLSFLGRLRFQTPVRDFHCGLRAVRRESFLALGCQCSGMEFATEMIGRAAYAKQDIEQVPIVLHRDGRGHKSHLHSVRDGFRHLFLMIRLSKGQCRKAWSKVEDGHENGKE